MFVIEVSSPTGKKSRHYWMNANGDDFLRYLPKNFGVQKSSLRLWMFADDEMPLLEGLLKDLEKEGALDLSVDGKIKVGRIVRTETPGETPESPATVSESFELLAEYSGVEVGWPYTDEWKLAQPELGTFLGFKPI